MVIVEDVEPGCLFRLRRAIPSLRREADATFWEGVVRAFINAPTAPDGLLRLSEIARETKCREQLLHERCATFEGREQLGVSLADTIASPVDALVLSHTGCLADGVHEEMTTDVISCHAQVGAHERLLAIARRRPFASESLHETAWSALSAALRLIQPKLVPGAAILAPQPLAARLSRLRCALAAHGLPYALRVDENIGFANHLRDYDDDQLDDDYERHPARYFFATGPHTTRPAVYPIEAVRRLPERLVASMVDNSSRYAVTRGSSTQESLQAAAALDALPDEPYVERARGHEFDHKNDATWQTIHMLVALTRGAIAL